VKVCRENYKKIRLIAIKTEITATDKIVFAEYETVTDLSFRKKEEIKMLNSNGVVVILKWLPLCHVFDKRIRINNSINIKYIR
jgi:hypothetical protein